MKTTWQLVLLCWKRPACVAFALQRLLAASKTNWCVTAYVPFRFKTLHNKTFFFFFLLLMLLEFVFCPMSLFCGQREMPTHARQDPSSLSGCNTFIVCLTKIWMKFQSKCSKVLKIWLEPFSSHCIINSGVSRTLFLCIVLCCVVWGFFLLPHLAFAQFWGWWKHIMNRKARGEKWRRLLVQHHGQLSTTDSSAPRPVQHHGQLSGCAEAPKQLDTREMEQISGLNTPRFARASGDKTLWRLVPREFGQKKDDPKPRLSTRRLIGGGAAGAAWRYLAVFFFWSLNHLCLLHHAVVAFWGTQVVVAGRAWRPLCTTGLSCSS